MEKNSHPKQTVVLAQDLHTSCWSSKQGQIAPFTMKAGATARVVPASTLDTMFPNRNIALNLGGWELKIQQPATIPIWFDVPGEAIVYFVPISHIQNPQQA